jgi:hypothetical protein
MRNYVIVRLLLSVVVLNSAIRALFTICFYIGQETIVNIIVSVVLLLCKGAFTRAFVCSCNLLILPAVAVC